MGFRQWLHEATAPNSPEETTKGADYGQDEDDADPYSKWTPLLKKMRMQEANLGLSDLDEGTEFSDKFFRSLERVGALDLPPQTIQRGQRLALLSWYKNVRAFAAVELKKDFVLGDGIAFSAEDDAVEELLREHWQLNQWDDRSEERLRSLGLFGEQLYPAFGNSKTGLIRFSSVNPLRIRQILRDKENAEDFVRAVTSGDKAAPASSPETAGITFTSGKPVEFSLIRFGEDGNLMFDKADGSWAFYFAVNRLAGATRGIPDIMSSIDWFEGLDGAIFSLMERLEIGQQIVYDIEYKGSTDQEVRKKAAEFAGALRSGGIHAHNDSVSLDIQSPNLGSSEAAVAIEILENQIAAGTGFSGLFFGKEKDLTRASAAELSIPVARRIQGRQNFFRRMISRIFELQIQYAISTKRLKADVDRSFTIEMPQAFLRDVKTITTSLVQLASSLSSAVRARWITNKEAAVTYRAALEQLGGKGRTLSSTDPDREDEPFQQDVGPKTGPSVNISVNGFNGDEDQLKVELAKIVKDMEKTEAATV